MKRGTLESLIQNFKLPISWPYRLRVALDIASALSYLHCMPILVLTVSDPQVQQPSPLVHLNVKSQNVLLCSLRPNAPVVAKLTDFGDARPVKQLSEEFYVPDPTYVAPEILLGKVYDEKGTCAQFL